MKKTLLHLLSGFCLTLVSINAFARSEQINICMTVFQEVEKEKDHTPKGDRIPAAPVICTINFENNRIETSIPYKITAYELWDEDVDAPILSYASDYDLVEYMEYVSGVFQLRIVTTERTYIGYLDL